ncbi:MAG: NAD(P)-dependent glycerol-1-phosphate dehydrogenase [Candidatus Verstraetearchaeota archaeon]|nr:NAD(P)-dependent glycerol-1-phosphate dehydrogenase [Candidatus Verstraetearchaeota archaeon]
MSIHAINLPRFVIVGSNVLPKVKEVLIRLSVKGDVLLVSGETYTKEPAELVKDSIEELGLTVHTIGVKDASEASVGAVECRIEESGASMVISVGGGKTIDIAKLASNKQNVPFISVPTSAAHDGISSPVASVKTKNGSTSIMAQPPIALLADTDIIVKSPRRYIISGVGDIVAKYTAVRDWGLAHRLRGEYYGEYSASLALMSAELITENIDLVARGLDAGIRVVIEALISCGYAMCIAGSSRPCSGSEHLFAHALDKNCAGKALHGERCGVGTIMMMYLHGGDWKNVKNVLSRVGAPTTAKQLGLKDQQLVDALTIAHTIRPERYTILGEKGITPEAAEDLARITGVID